MRRTAWVTAGVLTLLVGGWIIDDVLLPSDIGHNVTISGMDVGGLSRADAAERLNEAAEGTVILRYGGGETPVSLQQLGVSLTVTDAIAEATDSGPLSLRPVRWARSLVAKRHISADYEIDQETLAAFFASEGADLFDLPRESPTVAMADGRLVATNLPQQPPVDLERLTAELEAMLAGGSTQWSIDLPTVTDAHASGPLARLVDDINDLTDGGISVEVVGQRKRVLLRAEDLRSWTVVEGTLSRPTASLSSDAVLAGLREVFDDTAEPDSEPSFAVSGDGSVQILGSSPGSICCDESSAERIWNAVLSGASDVMVLPQEDPNVRGAAWAESLGIVELVGEFTTSYTPGQSRVTNIRRIAELTQGAVIEPGATFSVNDYVGRRTVANGFVSAGMILNGVFYPSVGGGISQYATTLFNAAFFAGLDFGEYQSHSIYLSRYPYGREATVSFPRPDLQIVNNTPYGVLIWPTSTEESITVQLYSTKTVVGEQTGQSERRVGRSCTLVTTERTRTWLDSDRTEVDQVVARYRPEGVACDGSSSVPTTTTTPPTT